MLVGPLVPQNRRLNDCPVVLANALRIAGNSHVVLCSSSSSSFWLQNQASHFTVLLGQRLRRSPDSFLGLLIIAFRAIEASDGNFEVPQLFLVRQKDAGHNEQYMYMIVIPGTGITETGSVEWKAFCCLSFYLKNTKNKRKNKFRSCQEKLIRAETCFIKSTIISA